MAENHEFRLQKRRESDKRRREAETPEKRRATCRLDRQKRYRERRKTCRSQDEAAADMTRLRTNQQHQLSSETNEQRQARLAQRGMTETMLSSQAQ